jgi:hypothetical protein
MTEIAEKATAWGIISRSFLRLKEFCHLFRGKGCRDSLPFLADPARHVLQKGCAGVW